MKNFAKKIFKYILPTRVKKALKIFFYSLLDIVDSIRGKRKTGLPPRKLNFVGSGDFENVGEEFKKLFIEIGELKSDDKILDIGCGVGRMALPLTTHIAKNGSYLGFDIVKKGIEWCQKNITPKHPNFKFIHANIKNKFYNAHGKIHSEEYIFPAEASQFSFCFATSVFTHMLPAEIEHYLEESARVMKKGGTIFFTFFLIPDDAQQKFETHCINFQYQLRGLALYSHKDCPEAEIGYPESWVKNLLQKNNFQQIKIYPGKWKDPKNGLSYQDIIVATKQ